MKKATNSFGRRNFLKTTTKLSAGFGGIFLFPETIQAINKTPEDSIHIIGPKEGYSTQVGTLVSMMSWMRSVVLRSVTNMTKEQLDYLYDKDSNTIGAMLLHLAATETYYQANTFDGRRNFNNEESKKFGVAMGLGDEGRKQIKGNNLDYYLGILNETREKTLREFRKKDDKWLMTVDAAFFSSQPTNNYCKWFHVCEHESNHNGQIKWIKSRLPGAKSSSD